MKINPIIFQAYDIRGIYPNELNEEVIAAISKAIVKWLSPPKFVIGHDVRISSPSLFKAAKEALVEAGVEVIDIGLISTDMLYFTAGKYHFDAGMIITGSHNPKEWNGIKIVRNGAKAVSSDSGLMEIKKIADEGNFPESAQPGKMVKKEILPEYIDHILSFIDIKKIKPKAPLRGKFKIVANPNFGAGINTLKALEKILPLEFVNLNFEINGEFPKGRPDPKRPETRAETSALIRKTKADFGVSWDADADRCFFFDENGTWIEPVYITALLASKLLKKFGGGKIIHDFRVIWPILKACKDYNGQALSQISGHSFFKERMLKVGALFSGESSAHYFFRDNYNADNGMIPFLLVLEEISGLGCKISELVAPWQENHYTPGEINFDVSDPEAKIKEVASHFKDCEIDWTDGASVEFEDWRFNLRASNTEPLLRLNIEAKSKKISDEKMRELEKLIKQ